MNKLALLTILLLVTTIVTPRPSFALPITAASSLTLADGSCDDSAWASWKAEHGKVYVSPLEDAQRCRVFM